MQYFKAMMAGITLLFGVGSANAGTFLLSQQFDPAVNNGLSNYSFQSELEWDGNDGDFTFTEGNKSLYVSFLGGKVWFVNYAVITGYLRGTAYRLEHKPYYLPAPYDRDYRSYLVFVGQGKADYRLSLDLPTISYDGLPLDIAQGVPEPEQWVLLVFGFAVIGTAMRVRAITTTAVPARPHRS